MCTEKQELHLRVAKSSALLPARGLVNDSPGDLRVMEVWLTAMPESTLMARNA